MSLHIMLKNDVLAHGVRIVADIHHSHGVKAALSIQHLQTLFPHWTDEFWFSTLTNAQWFAEPTVNQPVYAPISDMTPKRAQLLIARAVIPVSYGALRTWVDSVGAEAVVHHYLDQACLAPEYLGHRLSILLSFLDAWPSYRDGPDRLLFIDRLAEFLFACQFPLDGSKDAKKPEQYMTSWDAALSAALKHPGFFGHHLICLAWAGRSRDVLTATQFTHAMAWVVQASHTRYVDEADNIFIDDIENVSVSNVTLEQVLQDLLAQGIPNIHLLTLADAIAWLWETISIDSRRYLLAVAKRCIK